jgi:3-dehydroquinate synthase
LARQLPRISSGRRIVIIADQQAHRFHGSRLADALDSRFDTEVVLVPRGESSKSLRWVQRLYARFRSFNLARDELVLAFGGGVVGDLAGFAAATYMRGVRWVIVPTTLLSQIDSAIGGKVGVNFRSVKNLLGAFHQPSLVVSDIRTLRTLPRREIRSALAEVVKYGMIADPPLLRLLERFTKRILTGDVALLSRIVARCCRIKARIVESDPRDWGVRANLNYGHTLGHALEACAGGRLTHGEAIALGMRGAARLAEELGYLTPAERSRQDRILDRLGLPRRVSGLNRPAVIDKLLLDKKIRRRELRFVLTRGVGSATVAPPIEETRVHDVLADLLA